MEPECKLNRLQIQASFYPTHHLAGTEGFLSVCRRPGAGDVDTGRGENGKDSSVPGGWRERAALCRLVGRRLGMQPGLS